MKISLYLLKTLCTKFKHKIFTFKNYKFLKAENEKQTLNCTSITLKHYILNPSRKNPLCYQISVTFKILNFKAT